MDTIRSEWVSKNRIGNCVPLYNKNNMLEIEDYIIEKCKEYNLQSKYNVGLQIGGIPPKGDKTHIVNPDIHSIRYHDMLGGILISTRNGEVNSRNVDNILYDGKIDEELLKQIISSISDKYKLSDTTNKSNEIVFLPGSNIRHIVNIDRVEEILIDNPSALVKPHPIQTEEGLRRLKEQYGNRLIEENVSGVSLLKSAEVIWTTANSEIGLMSALLKKPFGDITHWKEYYNLLFAPVYRQFKYKQVDWNYSVIAKFLSSKKSGYIAYWMDDWKERVDLYFQYIINIRTKGASYPYNIEK